MEKFQLAAPVVKWVGGKRQILHEITKYIPEHFSTYYEPFVGGGAVLFKLQPKKAVINDINGELINVYEVIRDNVEELIKTLKEMDKYKHDKDHFLRIRELDRDKKKYNELTSIERAARVIFLNKTCYNGLFRVNSAGEFNVPFGNYKNPNVVNEITLRAVSNYFNQANIKITCNDFANVLKKARKGAFVYLDPPYDPVSDTSSFTGYDKGGFDQNEQIRLKKVCDNLHSKGINFLLSNSATDFIKDLYNEPHYQIEIIQAKRAINSKANKRGEIDEVLVRNFDL